MTPKLSLTLMALCFLLGAAVNGRVMSSRVAQAKASPIDHPVLEHWPTLFHEYAKTRPADEELDEFSLGNAVGDFRDAMQKAYHPRTVQEIAVKGMWILKRETELYANRWNEDE